MILVFVAFSILIAFTVVDRHQLTTICTKSREDWILDAVGLFFQGIAIPWLQIAVVYQLYSYLLPSDRASFHLPAFAAFLLSFVAVDYIYYWNHRLLHSPWLWKLHLVHHTMTNMDVLGTSRNTLWTSFFIVYLWIHALFIYLLADPTWYILGASLTSALDLWRHSAIAPTSKSLIYRCLSPWLILPQDHAWHHSSDLSGANYGANFKIWDKIHGTYYQSDRLPNSLGIETNLTLAQKLFQPR
ncbi:MAG: sterol desaturase family protein [Cyanosarcina radialis HA8281-LM2]|nr:sterol desaturase family protein [Cyanosarcina radialis HA8281-LM2]